MLGRLPTLRVAAFPAQGQVMQVAAAESVSPQQPGDCRPSMPLALCIAALAAGLIAAATQLRFREMTLAHIGASRVMPAVVLFLLRSVMAITVFFSLRSSIMDPEPHTFVLMIHPESKLVPRTVSFKGLDRLSTFTLQCWALQLLYFCSSAAASAAVLAGVDRAPSLLIRGISVLYEVCVATSLLVTTVVTFILLPARIRANDWDATRRMLGWRPQLMHNANTLFVVTELLLNAIPITASHFVFAALFGVWYVILSWVWLQKTGIVYYSFLDPTLPAPKAIAFHLGLVAVLAGFFALGALADQAAAFCPLLVLAPILYAVAASIMWTDFIRGRPKEIQGRDGKGGE